MHDGRREDEPGWALVSFVFAFIHPLLLLLLLLLLLEDFGRNPPPLFLPILPPSLPPSLTPSPPVAMESCDWSVTKRRRRSEAWGNWAWSHLAGEGGKEGGREGGTGRGFSDILGIRETNTEGREGGREGRKAHT